MVTTILSPLLVLTLAVGAGGCVDAFEVARQKDTAEAYRHFHLHNRDDPRVPEAKRLEAEAAFRELRDEATVKELTYYLERYPKSPHARDVKAHILEMRYEKIVEDRDLYGLKRLFKECPTEAFKQRVREAYEYLLGSRKALLLLKPAHFEAYIAKHKGGEFAKHARAALDWLEALEERPQGRILVLLDTSSVEANRARIARRFKKVKAIPTFKNKMGDLEKLEGRIVYRVTEVARGDKRQFYDHKGELVEITLGGNGVILEILVIRNGKVEPVWQWGTPQLQGLDVLDFPVINWDTRKAVIAARKGETTMGAIADFGQFLLVSTLDGFALYDPTSPDKLRLVYRYVRPSGVVRKSGDARGKLAISGKLVALYGDGVELLDCHNLNDIKRNVAADFSRVGEVTHGAFVKDQFFFVTKEGSLYQVGLDSRFPKQIGFGKYDMVASAGGELVVGSDDGLVFYNVGRNGGLGERSSLHSVRFPDDFNPESPVVASQAVKQGLLMVNGKGEIGLVRDGEVDTRYVNIDDLGKVYKLDLDGRWMASIGDGGLALRLHVRNAGRWFYIGAVPVYQCQGVTLRYPMAYLICGDTISSVHMGALVKKR